MNKILPWLKWSLATAVLTVLAVIAIYLVLVGMAWLYLQPLVATLDILAMGMQ